MYIQAFVVRNCVFQQRSGPNKTAQSLMPGDLFGMINGTIQTTLDIAMRNCCIELLRRMNAQKWGYRASARPPTAGASDASEFDVHISFDARVAQLGISGVSQKYVLSFNADHDVTQVVEQPSGRRLAQAL